MRNQLKIEEVKIEEVVEPRDKSRAEPPGGECIITTIPLRQLKRPKPRAKKAVKSAPVAARKPKKKR